MHHSIEIAVPVSLTEALTHDLTQLEDVIGMYLHRGASVKPSGDVITVHVLNRGTDAVLRCVAAHQSDHTISIATAELASLISPAHSERIHNDVDEAVWEEMETGLRHQGRVTINYLTLMALGGVIAAVGLVSDPVPQAIAFVSSAVIAPGFEPIAKLPLGLVLRRWMVLKQGMLSIAVGYTTLILAAAATFFLLTQTDPEMRTLFITNPEVERIAHPALTEILVSIAGAIAGIVMIAAYRRSVIAGPLIALILIPAAAMIGMGMVIGRTDLAVEGAERFLLDAALIVGLGVVVVGLKQALFHRRRSLL